MSKEPNDEGKPAGKDPQGNAEPAQPSTDDQSGSTGRRSPGKEDQGKDTGQGRYGQTGLGGKDKETDGQASYRKSGDKSGHQ